jgi:hypothetical protein
MSDANGKPISKDQWESAVRVKAGMRASKIWPIIRKMLSDHRMVTAQKYRMSEPEPSDGSDDYHDPKPSPGPCKRKNCSGKATHGGYCKSCNDGMKEDAFDMARGATKVAHPVWDLSTEGHGDPVVVRKIQEEAERGKIGEPGWLGRMASTYIGGKRVAGKVTAVDGTQITMDVDGEPVSSDLAFVSFLADRDAAEPASPLTKSAQEVPPAPKPRSIFQEWGDVAKAVGQSFGRGKKPGGKLNIKQEEQEGGMPLLDGGKNPDGSMILPDADELRTFLIKLLPSFSGKQKSAQQQTLPGMGAPPTPQQPAQPSPPQPAQPAQPAGLGINVSPQHNIRGPIIRRLTNELVRGIDNIRQRSINRMIDVYKDQFAPKLKERKYMDILWWWNREAIIQNQLGQIIQVLDKTYQAPMKAPYQQQSIHEVQEHKPENAPDQPEAVPQAPEPEQLELFKKAQALIQAELQKAAQRMGPNAASTFELQYIVRVLTKFGFPINDKQALMSVLELNKNHAVSNVVDRVPDADWAEFIQNVGKPAADDGALVDSRPEWWTQYRPVSPESEGSFDDYDIDEAPPMSMDEALPKKAQAQDTIKRNWMALEWLWWMADAGFSLNSYENMKELAAKFPISAHRGPALAASMSDTEYEDLWRSGQINQFGSMNGLPEKLQQHSEGDRGPVEDAWPANYRKWRENTNVNEPVKVVREVPKNDMMDVGEEAEVSMEDVRPKSIPSRMTNNDPKPTGTTNMTTVTQMPQRIPFNQVRPMPGFTSGQILKQPGGKLSVLIAKPGGRDQTTASVGQGVMLRKFGQGLGYIVGQDGGGKLVVWLEKLQDLRAVDASEVELDLKNRKLASVATIVADAVRNAQQQNQPMQPMQPGPSSPNAPTTQEGIPVQPGDIIKPKTDAGPPANPDNTGQVQSVGPDGSVVMQTEQGKPAAVAPDDTKKFEAIPSINI